jgi:hypothetical protein
MTTVGLEGRMTQETIGRAADLLCWARLRKEPFAGRTTALRQAGKALLAQARPAQQVRRLLNRVLRHPLLLATLVTPS